MTLLAAENDPINSGLAAYFVNCSSSTPRSMCPSRVLGDDHDVGDRLAPGQFVGVVLERADEHDRPLVCRDVRAQVVAVVELGRQAQPEDADELVDRPGGAGAGEDDGVVVGAADRVVDERRASSRSRVVCRPVPLDSVWVLA